MPTPSVQNLLDAAVASQTPVLIMDLSRVEAQYRALRAALPEAQVLYAIKANPHPAVLRRLASIGCGFDIASLGELELCRSISGPAALVSFGNTVKKEADIAAAHNLWREYKARKQEG